MFRRITKRIEHDLLLVNQQREKGMSVKLGISQDRKGKRRAKKKKLINRNLKSNSGGKLRNHISNDRKYSGGSVAKSCPTLVTPWTVARQAPLSMEFSRQEYWRGWPFPSPGIFPAQGSNPGLPHCRLILYQLSHKGSPDSKHKQINFTYQEMEMIRLD